MLIYPFSFGKKCDMMTLRRKFILFSCKGCIVYLGKNASFTLHPLWECRNLRRGGFEAMHFSVRGFCHALFILEGKT